MACELALLATLLESKACPVCISVLLQNKADAASGISVQFKKLCANTVALPERNRYCQRDISIHNCKWSLRGRSSVSTLTRHGCHYTVYTALQPNTMGTSA